MKEVIIKLGAGRIETGFATVNIELKQHGKTYWEDRDSLVAAPALKELLTQWLFLYPTVLNLSSNSRSLAVEFKDDALTNISIQDIKQIEHNLRRSMNQWLNQSNFSRIVGRIRTTLKPEDRIIITLVSEQQDIWKLPWHFWNIFEDYPHIVEVFCKPSFASVSDVRSHRDGKVNILGLFGEDPALELNPQFLATLPQARIEILETTSAYKISDLLTGNESWDIFIFNGHGDTIENEIVDSQEGLIYLDNHTPLEIGKLRNDLKCAIDRGLQIAIFNCCRGLGLADRLSDVNIPYIIVMREKIPDRVAQNFLVDLLTKYSQGDNFPTAFKYARERMSRANENFSQFADWLPVLFHNPLSDHVSWKHLAAPVFSFPIPPQIIGLCDYLCQPNQRIWKMVGLSLSIALLAVALKSNPQMIAVEDAIDDRLQMVRADNIQPDTSRVTIVNYNCLDMLGSGICSNSESLATAIDKITESKIKPLVWLFDLNFQVEHRLTASDLLKENQFNYFKGCTDRNLKIANLNYSRSELECNKESNAYETLLQQVRLQDVRLNRHLLAKISSIDSEQIENLSDVAAKKIFDRKIIAIGNFPKENPIASYVGRDALALDLMTRAVDPQQPLSLFVPWSGGLQFLWTFGWSLVMAIAAWQARWRLFVPLAIAIQIVITGLCLFLNLGVPILSGTLSTIVVGIAISTVRKIAEFRLSR